VAWGQWAERVGPETSAWRISVDGGAIGGDGVTGRTLDSAARLRESSAVLGTARVALLHACVVDQSWRRIGQRLGVAGDTARELVVEGDPGVDLVA
jgi:hypothetical protein